MKYFVLIFPVCSLLILTSCISGGKKKQFSVAKPPVYFYSRKETPQAINWTLEELFEHLQPLSDTNIPEDFNYNKDYILKLAWYLQSTSPEGIFYDEDRKVFMLELEDVQYWAKESLGVESFEYPESSEFNKQTNSFEVATYSDLGYVQKTYKNCDLRKISKNQWEFSMDVFESNENGKEIGTGVREKFVVYGKDETFKLMSVQRQPLGDEKEKEKDEQVKPAADRNR